MEKESSLNKCEEKDKDHPFVYIRKGQDNKEVT